MIAGRLGQPGHDTLSLTTLMLAAAIWVVLALLLSSRAAGRPPRRN